MRVNDAKKALLAKGDPEEGETEKGETKEVASAVVTEVELPTLGLREDYYAISYMGFITEVKLKFNLTRPDQYKNLFNCMFIFALQLILVSLVGAEIFKPEFQFVKVDY